MHVAGLKPRCCPGRAPSAGFREESIFLPFPTFWFMALSAIFKVSRVVSSILSLFYYHIAFSVTVKPFPAFLLKGHLSLHLESIGIIQHNLITSAKSHLPYKVTLSFQGLEFGCLWVHYSAYHTWQWWLFSHDQSQHLIWCPLPLPQTIYVSHAGLLSYVQKAFHISSPHLYSWLFLCLDQKFFLAPWFLALPVYPSWNKFLWSVCGFCSPVYLWLCKVLIGFPATLYTPYMRGLSPHKTHFLLFTWGAFSKWHIHYFHGNDRTGEGF